MKNGWRVMRSSPCGGRTVCVRIAIGEAAYDETSDASASAIPKPIIAMRGQRSAATSPSARPGAPSRRWFA